MTTDIDEKNRIVTGFFSTYNYVDMAGDVLLPGACSKSLSLRGPNGKANGNRIKHLLFHDQTKIPGRIIHLEEKKVGKWHGLYFETKMSETALGEETLAQYLDGTYDSHSIGYNYVPESTTMATPGTKLWDMLLELVRNPDEMRARDEVFVVAEIDLYEGSTVSLACNPETPFLGVKAKKSAKDMMKYLADNFKL